MLSWSQVVLSFRDDDLQLLLPAADWASSRTTSCRAATSLSSKFFRPIGRAQQVGDDRGLSIHACKRELARNRPMWSSFWIAW